MSAALSLSSRRTPRRRHVEPTSQPPSTTPPTPRQTYEPPSPGRWRVIITLDFATQLPPEPVVFGAALIELVDFCESAGIAAPIDTGVEIEWVRG